MRRERNTWDTFGFYCHAVTSLAFPLQTQKHSLAKYELPTPTFWACCNYYPLQNLKICLYLGKTWPFCHKNTTVHSTKSQPELAWCYVTSPLLNTPTRHNLHGSLYLLPNISQYVRETANSIKFCCYTTFKSHHVFVEDTQEAEMVAANVALYPFFTIRSGN